MTPVAVFVHATLIAVQSADIKFHVFILNVKANVFMKDMTTLNRDTIQKKRIQETHRKIVFSRIPNRKIQARICHMVYILETCRKILYSCTA